jgi:hypothetical protein
VDSLNAVKYVSVLDIGPASRLDAGLEKYVLIVVSTVVLLKSIVLNVRTPRVFMRFFFLVGACHAMDDPSILQYCCTSESVKTTFSNSHDLGSNDQLSPNSKKTKSSDKTVYWHTINVHDHRLSLVQDQS